MVLATDAPSGVTLPNCDSDAFAHPVDDCELWNRVWEISNSQLAYDAPKSATTLHARHQSNKARVGKNCTHSP